MEVAISKFKNSFKTYGARINDTKTVSFGEQGASDFTKQKYRTKRHIHRQT